MTSSSTARALVRRVRAAEALTRAQQLRSRAIFSWARERLFGERDTKIKQLEEEQDAHLVALGDLQARTRRVS